MSPRLLIINADDFGLCDSLNQAVEDAHRNGVLSSATIMTPTPGFHAAAEIARRNPSLSVGVHLTLTSEWPNLRWGPTLPSNEVPSLVNKSGYFPENMMGLFLGAKLKHVYAELKHQIELCLKEGIKIDHLDNHMGCTMLPPFSKVYRTLAREYQLPIRQAPLLSADFASVFEGNAFVRFLYNREKKNIVKSELPKLQWLTTPRWPHIEGEVYEDLRNEVMGILGDPTMKTTEFFVHPSLDTEEVRETNTAHWQKRVFEYQLLIDDEFKTFLRENNWSIGGYSDLISS